MAEQFANAWLEVNNCRGQYSFISRALSNAYEPENSPASSYGIQVLSEEYLLDLRNHRSVMLSSQDVDDAHLIIGVTKSHVRSIIGKYPTATAKVGSFSSDVPDPSHSSIEVYETCAAKMKELIDGKLHDLAKWSGTVYARSVVSSTSTVTNFPSPVHRNSVR